MSGVESQKEVFRKYLESAGAIDVLVKGESVSSRLCSKLGLPRLTYSLLRSFWPDYVPLLCVAVLVSLYEEPEKPKQALE